MPDIRQRKTAEKINLQAPRTGPLSQKFFDKISEKATGKPSPINDGGATRYKVVAMWK